MLKSLRYKLLAWFLAFTALSIVLILPYNLIYFNKKDKISEAANEINSFYICLLIDFKHIHHFLSFETSNPKFYLTGESKYIGLHNSNAKQIEDKISGLLKKNAISSIGVDEKVSFIHNLFSSYNETIQNITEALYQRGYKDYGLEGEMHNCFYKLESFKEIGTPGFFDIKWQEKEYLISGDTSHVGNLNRLCTRFKKWVISRPIKAERKSQILILVDDYSGVFNQLVLLDKKIGIKGNEGFKKDLDLLGENIETSCQKLVDEAENAKTTMFRNLEFYYSAFFTLLFVLSFLASFYISRRITQPLSKLTNYIVRLVDSNFKLKEKIEMSSSQGEIAILSDEFRKMIEQLHNREIEREKAGNDLLESEQKYRELTDLLPLSVYETDRFGNFNYVNKAWFDNFGFSHEDVAEGLNLIETIISSHNESIIGSFKFENNEFIAKRKDGSTFSSIVYTTPIIHESQTRGYLGIVLDNTESKRYIEALRKEKQKAEKSDHLKSAFLANMSHEIRTPMNAILGFTNLLQQNDISEDDKNDFIDNIKKSGELLLNLIEDIIDIAKIEADEIKINFMKCPVNSILSELYSNNIESINRNAKGKFVELRLKTALMSDNFNIISDPFRLKQILSNLLGNAIKFTQKGYVEFGYVIESFNNKPYVKFYVKDTGIGIPSSKKNIIFDRFRQVDDSTTRNYGGAGLGLTICKNLVELLGGKIWVESEVNQGSVFSFILPYQVVENVPKGLIIQDAQPISFDWKNKIALVVEDQEANFKFIKAVLKETKIQVLWAKNGKEAVDICRENSKIDIVLMDIQMPVMNGHDATKQIKKFRKNLPVISQTAYAMSGEREECIKAGSDDYIAKPVNPNQLKSMIAKYLTLNLGVGNEKIFDRN
jgi:PAS domain S-box-containing protein